MNVGQLKDELVVSAPEIAIQNRDLYQVRNIRIIARFVKYTDEQFYETEKDNCGIICYRTRARFTQNGCLLCFKCNTNAILQIYA